MKVMGHRDPKCFLQMRDACIICEVARTCSRIIDTSTNTMTMVVTFTLGGFHHIKHIACLLLLPDKCPLELCYNSSSKLRKCMAYTIYVYLQTSVFHPFLSNTLVNSNVKTWQKPRRCVSL